jgi:hypothetical protein
VAYNRVEQNVCDALRNLVILGTRMCMQRGFNAHGLLCVVEEHRPRLRSDGKVYHVRRAIYAVCDSMLCTSVVYNGV